MSRRITPSGGDEENWLTTYSDLVTLLLTFFVMLFSMAVLDQAKFREVAQSLQAAFVNADIKTGELFFDNPGKEVIDLTGSGGMLDDTGNISKIQDPSKAETEELRARTLGNVVEQIEKAITDLNLTGNVTIIDEEYKVILRLNTIILFDMGSAEIKPEGLDVIIKLGDILSQLDHNIVVNGHTCDLPINTALYPTNWELSTKRASNVARILIEDCNIPPERMTAAGHAEFKPLVPNTSEENRQQNRRIEIHIEK
ncbi:MAG TPA: OmpA family protein [Clostridiaceae bacterium]|jgi:chemotaxis protein MotB|nr:OmpA family protein [Clostridiaceae bacterium]